MKSPQANKFDYFYGSEAEQFSFYRIPKVLFSAQFQDLSTDAKVLYGLMLDRMSLSMKNGWVDEKNRVYIIFTLDDIQEYLNCGHCKGSKMLSELDSDKGIGLIERVKRGQGKPTLIYVKNFISNNVPNAEVKTAENQKSRVLKIGSQGIRKSEVKTAENQKSGLLNMRSQDFRKTDANNTYISNTEFSDLNQSIYPQNGEPEATQSTFQKPIDRIDRSAYREIILENIEYDALCEQYSPEKVDEIAELILDTLCTTKQIVWIGGEKIQAEVVRGRLLKLNQFHIEYVLDSLAKNTTQVRNIKGYMLKSIYNAPLTINHHYQAAVNYNLYGKGKDDDFDGT